MKEPLSCAAELNDFQQLMRRWAALGPYNAGHVMRVTGVADTNRWRNAIVDVLREIGVAGLEDLSVTISSAELDKKIADELNTPFPVGSCPLRAFAIAHGSEDYFFGVIFDHWFADSASMRLLMHRFFVSYQDTGGAHILPPFQLATPKAIEALIESKNFFGGFAALVASFRNYLRHRRAHRVKLSDPLDFSADFFSMNFPEGSIGRVRAAAKECDATVNDMFLAAAAQVLGARTSVAREHARRNRVGLATAVDLRPLAGRTLDEVFGFFLSYFTVVLERPDEQPLAKLAAAIAQETGALKSNARPVRFISSLRIARMVWDTFRGPRRKAQLFQKMLPLLAGISNVNLTGSWMDTADMREGAPGVIDYLRVSPVGPLLPLVFTLTTIGDRLSLCVTYRKTAFSRSEAQQIMHDFATRLLDV